MNGYLETSRNFGFTQLKPLRESTATATQMGLTYGQAVGCFTFQSTTGQLQFSKTGRYHMWFGWNQICWLRKIDAKKVAILKWSNFLELILSIYGYGSKPCTPGERQNSWDLWMWITTQIWYYRFWPMDIFCPKHIFSWVDYELPIFRAGFHLHHHAPRYHFSRPSSVGCHCVHLAIQQRVVNVIIPSAMIFEW